MEENLNHVETNSFHLLAPRITGSPSKLLGAFAAGADSELFGGALMCWSSTAIPAGHFFPPILNPFSHWLHMHMTLGSVTHSPILPGAPTCMSSANITNTS